MIRRGRHFSTSTTQRLAPQEGCVCGLLVCNSARCPVSNYQSWESSSLSRSDQDLAPYLGSGWGDTDDILDRIGFAAGQSLLDVGAGDGRVLLQAAHRGASAARGFELNEDVFLLGRDHLASSGQEVGGRCTLVHGDGLQAKFAAFDVVFAFLLPRGLEMLGKRLRELQSVSVNRDTTRPKTTVVTRGWEMKEFRSAQNDHFVLSGGSDVFVYGIHLSAAEPRC